MLESILRAGDRVRMKMDSEARSYGRKGVTDGTLGTVTGRKRVEGIIENRYPLYSREPGIYARDTVILVTWDKYPKGVDPTDQEYNCVSAISLEPADTFYKEYQARYAKEWAVRLPNGELNPNFDTIKERDRLDNLERIGDLPETKFWELDIVSWKGKRYRIHSISYNGWGPEKRHCYSMEEVDENNVYKRNGSLTVEPRELILIERGNVWREGHGEPLVFHSLEEEIRFAINMGRANEVRNPKNDLYSWSLEEVLQAIRDDIVDGFTGSTGLFSDQKRLSARRFEDRNLGERIRQKTLDGFSTILS